MSARRSLLVALSAAVAACALLAGCAASPAPTAPPRTPSPAPAPTVEAEPAAGVLRFTASAVTVETTDGEVLERFDYFAPAADAVAVLTEAFGTSPTRGARAGL